MHDTDAKNRFQVNCRVPFETKGATGIYPNLKLRMYTTGMRQNRLAKLVGIDEAYLSRIINGVRVPRQRMRQEIAKVLGCDVNWLFETVDRDSSTIGVNMSAGGSLSTSN